MARNHLVCSFPSRSGDDPGNACQFPATAKLFERTQHGLRAHERAFGGLRELGYYDDSVEIVGGQAVTMQEGLSKFRLERCETKLIAAIVTQQELDQAIAESAHAVV